MNLVLAGCALGVVSERGERQSSRRVDVTRRCEFGVDGNWFPATIGDVSVNGANLKVIGKDLMTMPQNARGYIRFKPARGDVGELPVSIRNVRKDGDFIAVGCRYEPQKAQDHSLIADLIFANSTQWSQFQVSRRRNPGLLLGTAWFLGVAIYQTNRGLVYFFRAIKQELVKKPNAEGAKN